MLTLIFFALVILGLAVALTHGHGAAGASSIIDRDAQRLQGELNAIYSHSHHH